MLTVSGILVALVDKEKISEDMLRFQTQHTTGTSSCLNSLEKRKVTTISKDTAHVSSGSPSIENRSLVGVVYEVDLANDKLKGAKKSRNISVRT